MSEGREGPHLLALDGVRGIAVSSVALYHGWLIWTMPAANVFDRAAAAFAAEGWVGVDLFFVLSGFLITRILLRERGSAHYFRNFYVRRTLRIFPLYYAFIAVACVVAPAIFPHRSFFQVLGDNQAWFWLYVWNFRIFVQRNWLSPLDNCWSLSVEEQFYLVWPLVVSLVPRRPLLVVAATLAFGCMALRLWMAHAGFTVPQIYVFTPARCDGLMLGGAIAILEASGVARPVMMRLAWLAAGCGLAVRLFVAVRVGEHDTVHDGLLSTAWALLFAGLIAASTSLPEGASLNRFLCARPLRVLGKYSYAIYLFHEVIFMGANKTLQHVRIPQSAIATQLARFAIAGPAVLLLAVLSFHLFESRFLRLKSRFS